MAVSENRGALAGKVAIVTGGATGVGKAICKLFAREGAYVVVNGIVRDPIDQVVEDIQAAGGTAVGCPVDAGTVAGAAHIVRDTCVAFGKLDILIANSDVVLDGCDLDELRPARFEELVRSCIRAVYYTCRAALPALRESRGCILTTASAGNVHGVASSALTGYLIGFTRALAVEQARYGVRANTLQISRDEAIDTPEQVAGAFLLLASPEATHISGAVTPVAPDGGMVAH